MKKLEDEIIKKIYKYETRNTALDLFVRIFLLLLMTLICGSLLYVIYITLYEQQTLEVLQIFQEDGEIIKEYFGDVMEILYYEIPKTQIIFFVLAAILLFFIVLYFYKNFGRIRRKIKALMAYWQK